MSLTLPNTLTLITGGVTCFAVCVGGMYALVRWLLKLGQWLASVNAMSEGFRATTRLTAVVTDLQRRVEELERRMG